jgi:parvulin-like peptidyl-prolyl isomerase
MYWPSTPATQALPLEIRMSNAPSRPGTFAFVLPFLTLAAGAAAGWYVRGPAPALAPVEPPAQWVAQVEGDYISTDMFIEEMRRRGGSRPGQYQDLEQKRALLDDMVLKQALVQAAREDGIDREPEVRRALDQMLANQYLQRGLLQRQADIRISEDDVRARYASAAAEYAVPARRRLALIRFSVPAEPVAVDWEAAERRAEEALAEARQLPESVPHFGALANRFSEDQDSRWRGGVVGWISDQAAAQETSSLDPAVLSTARALSAPGDFSAPIRGSDAVYVLRLVDVDAGRTRSFEELADGIRQGLRQQRLAEMEHEFREDLLGRMRTIVRDEALAAIDPLSPPASAEPLQPPALPGDRG